MQILVVDDDSAIQQLLKRLLQKDHGVVTCGDGEQALAALQKASFDVVITDHMMPGFSGLNLIKKGKEFSPSTAFLLMTAFGTVNQAIEAIRLGADDYFLKPFETDEISHRIRRIEELRSWRRENVLRGELHAGVSRLIGESPAMRAAREFVTKVAPALSPVLLLGPSGSGKEVAAKAIHEAGPRGLKPFIGINCASLNEQLIESELFGHEKGAFTGAMTAKPGKFELAQGGTLFLDEIGELSASLQAKLLRVLEEKEFYRVGGVRQIKTDARVIAATHRPLKEMVDTGSFREDLYFRLNVLVLELPSLSQRTEDVPLLIEHLWNKLGEETGRKTTLSPEVIAQLRRYSYPGNVRELKNVLERILVLGPQAASNPSALPPEFGVSPPSQASAPPACSPPLDAERLKERGLNSLVEEYESQLVFLAMRLADSNQARAGEILGITRGALQYKLKKYGATGTETEQAA